MGLPDFTTINDNKITKEWAHDACITISLHEDELLIAYWLEKQGQVKIVKNNGHQKIPAALSITQEAAVLITDSDSNLQGVLFGKDAISAGNETTDVVFPLALLDETLKNNNTMKTSYGEYETTISIKAASGKLVDISSSVVVRLLLQKLFEPAVQGYILDTSEPNETKTKGKKSKAKTKPQTLNLVVPSFVSCAYKHALKTAASSAGMSTRNVFGNGVATVIGSLYRLSAAKTASAPVTKLLQSLRESETTVLAVSVGKQLVDVSVVVCEGPVKSNTAANRLGFHRISTLATSGSFLTGDESAAEVLAAVVLHLEAVLGRVSAASISAVVQCGQTGVIGKALDKASVSTGVIVEALVDDAVLGGCLLSAAELDSSKEYIQTEDGSWAISYILPIADSILNYSLGLYVESTESDEKKSYSDGDVEVIFDGQLRLSKADVGPLLAGRTLLPKEYSRHFKWGSLYSRGPRDYKAGYPRVTLVEKMAGKWHRVDRFKPLEGPVTEATFIVKLNAAEGGVSVIEKCGASVESMRGRQWGWIKTILGILSIFALVGGAFLTQYLSKRSEVMSHEQWLREFYVIHAPDKMNDAEYIRRTIAKYDGKMFLLWRKLEKTYNTKYRPPESIKQDL
jgi:hypothetical protein